MDAVIIAGGLGTRLYPLTLAYPKSLIPLLDRPLVGYLLDLAARAGCERVVLAVGHLRDELRDWLMDEERQAEGDRAHGLSAPQVSFAEEHEPLGTGGAVTNAVRQLNLSGPLLVLNGDIVTDLEPRSLLATHERGGALATLVGYQVPEPKSFGLLRVGDEGRITSFQEKSEHPGDPPYVINAGIYYLDTAAVDMLAAREGAFSMEREFFPQLAHSLFKDLIYLHQQAKMGAGCELFHRVIVMAGAELGEGCHLQDTMVLPGARVGEGCALTTSIVDRGTSVPPSTRAENTVFSGKHQEPFFPHP
ncbi:MAG: hypothetical protein B1H03_07425 [Planctomycetales bacterium 4484_113]|nr:MAG: hypothetical protein B1H03_07425 [Planctomycetales bacterium 4484_113]